MEWAAQAAEPACWDYRREAELQLSALAQLRPASQPCSLLHERVRNGPLAWPNEASAGEPACGTGQPPIGVEDAQRWCVKLCPTHYQIQL